MRSEHGIIHSRSQDAIDYAYEFAKKAHDGQKRKHTDEPYIIHPVAVAKMVGEVTDDCDMIIAALLHDVVEDTDHIFESLADAGFNSRVIGFVKELTEFSLKSDGNRSFRKELDRRYLARASAQSKTIKLADVIHNSESIIKHSPGFAVVYMREIKALLDVITEGDILLYQKATDIVKNFEQAK